MTRAQALLDRSGVFASVFCAIHCAIAPVFLLFAPAFGSFWSHPLSHLAIAGFVLPVAAIALRKGFRSHRRKWVVALGTCGIACILVGAILPYFATTGCENCDNCCPSVVIDPTTGEESLNIPPASIVTLIGGVFLVTAHLANLRCCARCGSSS